MVKKNKIVIGECSSKVDRWLITVSDGKYNHEIEVLGKLSILDNISKVLVNDFVIDFRHMEILSYKRVID